MSTNKPAPAQIEAAKNLLQKEGYEIKKPRPDPRIGDVVRIKGSGKTFDALIVFHETSDADYQYGGVEVSTGDYCHIYTENLWIDREEWAKDDGQYTVIGHVNLDKWIKK